MSIELKTASGGSVTLVPEDGVSNTQVVVRNESGALASEEFVLNNDLGVGQTWQDVTASRSIGVTYTNNTGKPIYVFIVSGNSNSTAVNINGLTQVGNSTERDTWFFPLPDGDTYSTSGGNLLCWFELR